MDKPIKKYEAVAGLISIAMSVAAAVLFYKPFLLAYEYLFGISVGGGFFEFTFSERFEVFDFAFASFLSLFLSFFLDWEKTLRQWIIGYALLLLASFFFVFGIYAYSILRIFFVIVFACAGFLLGQGIRFIALQVTKKQ